jgi:HK97 family phage major capsid protein
MNRSELTQKAERLQGELNELKRRYEEERSEGLLERTSNVKAALVRTQKEIIEDVVAEGNPANLVPSDGSTWDSQGRNWTPPGGQATTRANSPLDNVRDGALRAIEARSSEIDSISGDRLISVVERDKAGVDAQYIEAISSPAYERAFGRMLSNQSPGAAQILSPEEAEAVQKVGAAMTMRAMAIGEGSTGGYAVPLALDPTILLTSAGAVNPLRKLASVSTIATSEWAGITSAGVTAHFVAEATEASDDSPTLGQPKIKPEKAQAFVPFSIEVGGDWGGLQTELAKLFADAKEVLEAEKMVSGDGSDEPFGIVTGATEVVTTATKGAFAEADVYSLQEALPPRFRQQASWLASDTIANDVYRMAGPGSEVPALMNVDRTAILGKPYAEVSTMQGAVTEGKVIAIYGDIAAGFKIVDRIGMQIELVPHLFGENGRPTGERGLYAYWRVGSKVVVPNALRALKVKNT